MSVSSCRLRIEIHVCELYPKLQDLELIENTLWQGQVNACVRVSYLRVLLKKMSQIPQHNIKLMGSSKARYVDNISSYEETIAAQECFLKPI